MKKSRIAIILLVVVIVIISLGLILANIGGDVNNRNSTNSTNNTNGSNVPKNNTDVNNVIATQDGPSEAEKGSEITVVWTVTNKGSSPITNVKAVSQFGEYNFGSLTPGESRTTSFQVPTSGPIEDNPDILFIGGFALEYDFKGKHYKMNSNPIEVKLR